ncbi:(2Fe-2S)-binding protein [Streptomyces sp. NPDC005794]|uniref:(2Fe-2S)-binding protein n=1 Tax=Streptomyces sp. NPDC005794 TaxID=3364733 RepID=UPI003698E6EF
MSNEENPEQQHGQPAPYTGWQPTPQGGEYDAEATAFVHLPPEDLADLGADPLAAPGHSYVPPMILPLTPAAGLDPAATGSWVLQTQNQQERAAGHSTGAEAAPEAVHWPDPNQQPDPYRQDSYRQDPYRQDPYQQDAYQQPYPDTSQYAQTSSTTAQWNFTESVPVEPEPAPEPAGHTGQWTIPVASGDLPDESGEFAASAIASQWYADTPPATLPGGAPAPWATQEPVPEPEPEPAAEEAPPGPSEPVEAQEAAAAPATTEETEGTPAVAEDVTEPVSEPEGPAEAEAPEAPEAEVPAVVEVSEAEVPEAEAGAGLEPGTEPGFESGTEPGFEPGIESGFEPAPGQASGPVLEHGLEQGLMATEEPAAAAVPSGPSEHPSASYVLHVNGVDRPVSDSWIGESLLYVLRERLGLAGAKDGCSQGECGACNVQVDGRLVASCLVPAATTAGSEVRTVEGLAVDGEPSDVQRALAECGAVQCGFCIPGMAMTVHDLLEGNHAPSELETRQALCGNLCRCSGYRGVLDAVRDVVAGREATAEAAATAPDDDAPRIPHQAAPGAGSVQAHEGDVR